MKKILALALVFLMVTSSIALATETPGAVDAALVEQIQALTPEDRVALIAAMIVYMGFAGETPLLEERLNTITSGFSAPADTTENTDAEHAAADNHPEVSGTVGVHTITIKSIRVTKDYEGKDCVAVLYEWSHTSDSSEMFFSSISDKVFQGGIQLNATICEDADAFSMTSFTEIKAGAVIQVEQAYLLRDATPEIEIEIEEAFSFSKEIISAKFNLPL